MNKKYKISLTILLILILICTCLLLYKKFIYDNSKPKEQVKTSVIDNMKNYGYSLEDRDLEVYKKTYYELKQIIDAEQIDYEQYAQKVAELFLIDLFTISNKINKYDVGGLDYLYESEREMFKNKVMDTIYADVIDNSYDNRNQELPTVKSITTLEVEEDTYQLTEDKKLKAFKFQMEIEYEKDMGYDKKVEVVAVNDNDKIYIVKYTAIK